VTLLYFLLFDIGLSLLELSALEHYFLDRSGVEDRLLTPAWATCGEQGGEHMKVVAINHDIADYDTWKAVFDEIPPSTMGALFHRINRSVDDHNNITVVAGFSSVETAKAFTMNPDLKEAMGRAGVTGAPRIEIFEEVESVQY